MTKNCNKVTKFYDFNTGREAIAPYQFKGNLILRNLSSYQNYDNFEIMYLLFSPNWVSVLRQEALIYLQQTPFLFSTILTRENCVLLNSVQEFIEKEAWLPLVFCLCLYKESLNKKEIQLNLCEIFSIWILNCVKLGRAVTFMKYLASLVSLIFLPKT